MLVEMPGKVPEGSNQCRYLVRFRRVPLQIPVAVLEGSGADTWSASGGFLCRYLLRFLALVPLPLRSTIACLYVYDCIQSRSFQADGDST